MKTTLISLLILATVFVLTGCDKDGPGSIELTNLSNTILPIILYEVVEDGDDIRVDGGFSLLHDQVHTWEKLAAGTKMYLQTDYAANSGRPISSPMSLPSKAIESCISKRGLHGFGFSKSKIIPKKLAHIKKKVVTIF